MRKLALLCAPVLLALASCSSAPQTTAADQAAAKPGAAAQPGAAAKSGAAAKPDKAGENPADVRDTGDLVRLMRLTTHYEYEPYASPRAMLKKVDVALVGTVVSVKPALIADELDGQGAIIVGLRPKEIWKDDSGRTGDVVHYYIQRPKNLGADVYRAGLPTGTEVALFGFDAANLAKFSKGDPGGKTYAAAPQGLMIADRDAELINVWGAEGESAPWKKIHTVKDLKAAIGK